MACQHGSNEYGSELDYTEAPRQRNESFSYFLGSWIRLDARDGHRRHRYDRSARMLMQTYGNESRTIRMLPAWPGNWTADFKLCAPFETTVEGRVESGTLERLQIDPPERRKDVVIGAS